VSKEDLDRGEESSLVLMVSVLDVLSQPVLGPVDLLASNRDLLLFKDDKELVVLHLVLNTAVVGNLTELAFLIVKVFLQQSLQVFQDSGILRVLGDSKDLLEENIVFSINLRIVSGKGFIPNIRFRYWVSQLSSVSKVSVHDVLSKPVLSPFDFTQINWSIHLGKSFTEKDMLLLVVLAVVPGDFFGFADILLFMHEMFSHDILECFNFVLAHKILFNSSEGIKETNVLLIKIFVKDSELFTPDIWLWNLVSCRKGICTGSQCF